MLLPFGDKLVDEHVSCHSGTEFVFQDEVFKLLTFHSNSRVIAEHLKVGISITTDRKKEGYHFCDTIYGVKS